MPISWTFCNTRSSTQIRAKHTKHWYIEMGHQPLLKGLIRLNFRKYSFCQRNIILFICTNTFGYPITEFAKFAG